MNSVPSNPQDDNIQIPLRRCTRCDGEFPETTEFFYRRKGRKDEWRNPCKNCQSQTISNYYYSHKESCIQAAKAWHDDHRESHAQMQKTWVENNKYRHAQLVRAHHLKKFYGMSVDNWDTLYAMQSGVCPICERSLEERRSCVDHSHVTGEVRGLLCNSCNAALGLMRDIPDNLLRAYFYLLDSSEDV